MTRRDWLFVVVVAALCAFFYAEGYDAGVTGQRSLALGAELLR